MLLPPLPRVNRPEVEHLKALNKKALHSQPWTLGLVEAVAAVNVLSRQKFDTRNRIALILLDSTFEIGLKEFIVHRPDLFPPKTFDQVRLANLFKNRTDVLAEVVKHVPIDSALLDKAKHYYQLRNKFIHERATVDVVDTDIRNYKTTVESVLRTLFKLKFTIPSR